MRRRGFVAALAGATAGVTVPATGCLGSRGVTVLSAGSLAVVLDENLGPAFEDDTGTAYRGEYYGSKAVMRMVEERQKDPDVVVSADAGLLRRRLYDGHTDWDVVFGSNSVGITYNEGTRIGKRLRDGEPWYEVLRDADDGDVAISDPELDPLGYRAVQMFELAEEKHGLDGFKNEMVSKVYEEPQEPQLLAGVRSGTRSAAVAYRNMAVDHDLPFHEPPDELNFSNPELADTYAEATYTTEDGDTVRGSPVLYNATVLDGADRYGAGIGFVNYLLDSPDTLRRNGLSVPEIRYNGEVPEEVSA
ncbi:extracellular solute-binding protein [Haladaptatus sp. F3-133]|uniref:Extracellular solute-binding protein n=1 Tax=Halorutilus salinus TaxID=2487751 RepID=A0A9Q4GJR3_9EURY|nr:extracellular solute-binding protein [Halorutilus salinus]MCX2819471.1 extracellular solute-binding protein [Halorutilus salinus]